MLPLYEVLPRLSRLDVEDGSFNGTSTNRSSRQPKSPFRRVWQVEPILTCPKGWFAKGALKCNTRCEPSCLLNSLFTSKPQHQCHFLIKEAMLRSFVVPSALNMCPFPGQLSPVMLAITDCLADVPDCAYRRQISCPKSDILACTANG